MQKIEKVLEENKGIIIYMANKYRFLDEWDDLISWGHIGFLNAYKEHNTRGDIGLPTLMFQHIKKVYIQEYFEKSKVLSKENVSMDKMNGDEGSDFHNYLADDSFHYTEEDIKNMVLEALLANEPTEQEIIMKYYLGDIDIESLANEYKISQRMIKRLLKRGQILIKRYLHNNDLITEWEIKPIEYTLVGSDSVIALRPKQCRQLKYIIRSYPVLNRIDYANILECDIHLINNTLDYPTLTYIRYGLDESIKDKAEAYISEHYPYMLPSEVKVYDGRAG